MLSHHLKKACASFRGVSVGHITWTFLREDLEGQERGRSTHLRKMISEAPLLYIRKPPLGFWMTVLMDLRTELKVYTL